LPKKKKLPAHWRQQIRGAEAFSGRPVAAWRIAGRSTHDRTQMDTGHRFENPVEGEIYECVGTHCGRDSSMLMWPDQPLRESAYRWPVVAWPRTGEERDQQMKLTRAGCCGHHVDESECRSCPETIECPNIHALASKDIEKPRGTLPDLRAASGLAWVEECPSNVVIGISASSSGQPGLLGKAESDRRVRGIGDAEDENRRRGGEDRRQPPPQITKQLCSPSRQIPGDPGARNRRTRRQLPLTPASRAERWSAPALVMMAMISPRSTSAIERRARDRARTLRGEDRSVAR